MKKKVNNEILSDMRRYIKDLNEDDYEVCYDDKTNPSVIRYVSEYYDNNLPVDLLSWYKVNEPRKKDDPFNELERQILFVIENISWLIFPETKDWDKNIPEVMSIYYLDSIKLPVYRLYIKKYDLEIVMRNDFDCWVVSIDSKNEIDFDFSDLIDTKEDVHESFCKDFPSDKIYECYDKNHKKFTFYTVFDYDLYTFMYLLKKYLDKLPILEKL